MKKTKYLVLIFLSVVVIILNISWLTKKFPLSTGEKIIFGTEHYGKDCSDITVFTDGAAFNMSSRDNLFVGIDDIDQYNYMNKYLQGVEFDKAGINIVFIQANGTNSVKENKILKWHSELFFKNFEIKRGKRFILLLDKHKKVRYFAPGFNPKDIALLLHRYGVDI